MALLPILRFPDPRLRTVAAPVTNIDDSIRAMAADMAETMYEAPGIGLAATQVDFHKQLIVIDVSEAKDTLLVLVNPEILAEDGQQVGEEGCLSVPGVYDKVERAERVTVRYQDLDGKTQTRLPWDSWKKPYVLEEPTIWFHEVFRADGTPYRQAEVDLIRRLSAAPRGVVPARP